MNCEELRNDINRLKEFRETLKQKLDAHERKEFEKIWNEGSLKNGGRGIYIGENIDSLPKSLM